MPPIDWSSQRFHPVVVLPPQTVVLDLSTGEPPNPPSPWSIGRYDEVRPGMYTTALFEDGRCLHVGADLGGPVGTAVHAFADGHIVHCGFNPADGDYGHVLVTEHVLDGESIYALFGHLSAASSARWRAGQAFEAGDVLGWLGDRAENGGWAPHVHFQLAIERPETHDMPGTVLAEHRAQALIAYPDPRLVLGPLW
ncbi:MAG: peptidoglycan DD-metalloendopeptidase family protein [Proteobacteria bacterium]|nr:peptidoglycan DD-metalloendopeptidase family protein [Pseudomonadota bacterium]